MRQLFLALGAAALLAGCGESTTEPATNDAANVAKPAVHHFCFFKPEETKGWAIKSDGKGNLTVSGKAHIKDSRYKADLGQPEVDGANATLWLSMQPNMTGYGGVDDWWDVSFTIPNTSAIRNVAVRCDDKRTLALFAVNH